MKKNKITPFKYKLLDAVWGIKLECLTNIKCLTNINGNLAFVYYGDFVSQLSSYEHLFKHQLSKTFHIYKNIS
jgi:hypothetical protein